MATPYGIEVQTARGTSYMVTPMMMVLPDDYRRIALLFDREWSMALGRVMTGNVGEREPVLDINGEAWYVSRASCGSGCACAMAVEPMTEEQSLTHWDPA